MAVSTGLYREASRGFDFNIEDHSVAVSGLTDLRRSLTVLHSDPTHAVPLVRSVRPAAQSTAQVKALRSPVIHQHAVWDFAHT